MKRLLVLLAAALTVSGATAVHAAESMNYVRDPDRNCAAAQESQGLWHASDGVIRMSRGTGTFEFYGHGLDLTRSASVTGISGGPSARVDSGTSGLVNGARHCGNIGSAVVTLTLPRVSSANSGVLHIGRDTVPIRVVPDVVQSIRWDELNPTDGDLTAAEAQRRMIQRDADRRQVALDSCGPLLHDGNGNNVCPVGNFYSRQLRDQVCAELTAMGATGCDLANSRILPPIGSGNRSSPIASVGNCGDMA